MNRRGFALCLVSGKPAVKSIGHTKTQIRNTTSPRPPARLLFAAFAIPRPWPTIFRPTVTLQSVSMLMSTRYGSCAVGSRCSRCSITSCTRIPRSGTTCAMSFDPPFLIRLTGKTTPSWSSGTSSSQGSGSTARPKQHFGPDERQDWAVTPVNLHWVVLAYTLVCHAI